jgi:hypothetical protein
MLRFGFINLYARQPLCPLEISAESAPAGGWVQLKIFAAKPTAISSGHLVLSFDSTAFGNGATVGLFGANGDAQGLATVNWPQVDVQFSSASCGIGQIAGLLLTIEKAELSRSTTYELTSNRGFLRGPNIVHSN